MITLTQLEYIVAVDQFRHYGKAAEKCFITQPTLSMQIKKLEEDLGVTIFDRDRQPLVPTEIGTAIIEQARKTLHDAQQINSVIEDHKHYIGGTLRLGIIPTLSPYLLPLFIGNLRRDYPRLNIKVEELFTEKIITALRKDTIDIGILVTPLHEEKIIERPLFYEEMEVYAHPDHPLSKHKTLKVQDVSLSDIWLLSNGHCFRNQVINLCGKNNAHKTKLPFEFEAGSMETLLKIVDNEGGVTLIPELVKGDMNDRRRNNVREFEGVKPLREVSLVYSEFYNRNKVIDLLRNEIMKSVPANLLNKNRGMIVEWK